MTALLACTPAHAADNALPAAAAEIYRRAESGHWFAEARKLDATLQATSDGKSFVLIWRPPGAAPQRWIASLHGSRGFATDDLAIWHRTLKDRNIGLVSLQWWIGSDDAPPSYYAPLQIYRELDRALASVGAQPGSVMLHGFSRGSANSYVVAAIDAGRGRRYFGLSVASSGGVAVDYPPTRALLSGAFGARPLAGSRWITVAGQRDPSPDRDGIPAMQRTAQWLQEQGATVVERIEDPTTGHGALQLNPANARRVLELFTGAAR